MALTSYLIRQASDHLSDVEIELWKTLFKALPDYNQYAIVYSKLVDDALISADGTLKARQLNALMKLIDDLGPGEISIKADADGLFYSMPDERLAIIKEAFDVIFDSINNLIVPFMSPASFVAVGQRPLCNSPSTGNPAIVCVRHGTYRCGFCS